MAQIRQLTSELSRPFGSGNVDDLVGSLVEATLLRCGIPAIYEPTARDRETLPLDVLDDATPVEAAMQADGGEPYTCSIARIIAFFSSRKSRSSYPYRL